MAGSETVKLSEPVVFLLWAQYGDRSGETMIAVFEDNDDAKDAARLIEAGQPSMNIRIDAVAWRSATRRSLGEG
jgi:hypothetical protein